MSPEGSSALREARSPWAAALAALELSLSDPATLAAWTPPAGLGPLPAELLPRARLLLGQQDELSRRLEGERHSLGRHLAALRSVPAAHDRGRPVYLDATA